ncbi:MAG: MFS transporter [Spirochaetia bacterium]
MFRSLDRATRRLYFLLLTCFVLFGLIFTVAGAALPQIIRTFGWSYTVTGLVLAASSAGYFLSSFLNGFLVQRFPPRLIMVIGLVLGAFSMSLFVRWPSPWLNLLLNFGIGLCQGAMEVVTDLEVIHMEQKGQSRLMNLIHASFCVGAIVGPSAVGYILNARIPLVSVFIASAILSGILAVLFAFTRFPRVRHEPKQAAHNDVRLLRQPLLLLMTAALLFYVGTEIGVSSWSSEYVVKVLGVSASTAAFAVALFWLGLLAGRLGISFGYRGVRQELLMLALSVLSAVALVAVLIARSTAAVAAAVFIAGLGCSGFYPLGMSLLGKHFKSGVAVGTAATGGAAGSIAFPFMMALISQNVGIRSGFWFYLGMNVLLVVLSVFLVRLVRRGRPADG